MSFSNKSFSLALFFCLNLLFSSLTIAQPVVPAPSPSGGNCSIANSGACARVLGLINVGVSNSQDLGPCCSFVQGLLDFDAAACICAVAKSSFNVFGIRLTLPVNTVSNIALNSCNRTPPSGFNCVA